MPPRHGVFGAKALPEGTKALRQLHTPGGVPSKHNHDGTCSAPRRREADGPENESEVEAEVEVESDVEDCKPEEPLEELRAAADAAAKRLAEAERALAAARATAAAKAAAAAAAIAAEAEAASAADPTVEAGEEAEAEEAAEEEAEAEAEEDGKEEEGEEELLPAGVRVGGLCLATTLHAGERKCFKAVLLRVRPSRPRLLVKFQAEMSRDWPRLA